MLCSRCERSQIFMLMDNTVNVPMLNLSKAFDMVNQYGHHTTQRTNSFSIEYSIDLQGWYQARRNHHMKRDYPSAL